MELQNCQNVYNKKSTLNRNVLKYIAIFAMLLDHIAASSLLPTSILYIIFRTIGRITAPTMCFFLVEGFFYTSSRKKYALRLFIFAIISQYPWSIFTYSNIFSSYSMISNLFLSFILLCTYNSKISIVFKTIVAVAIFYASTFCDWFIIAPLYVTSFYFFRKYKATNLIVFVIISSILVFSDIIYTISSKMPWYLEIWQLGVFLFIPLILFYNGEKGNSSQFNKWFFYVFYPLHLLILAYFIA